MAGGYIRLWRKIQDWEWYDDPPVLCFFIFCLTSAAYEPTTYKGEDVGTGEFITDLNRISSKTGLTIRQIRTAIEKLTKTGEIDTQATNKRTLIKVRNYAEYQAVDNSGATSKRQANDTQSDTHSDTQSDKRPSLYRKEKRRKKKEYIPPISPKGDKKQEGETEEEVKPFDPYDPNCPKSDKPFDPEDPTTWNIYV